jgi:hypothetical protein
MAALPKHYITIEGIKMPVQFTVTDSPTKVGVNMQFVLENEPEDPRKKQELANKISVALQKRFGESNIAVDYNERNPYKNVISYIIPISSISQVLMRVLKGE